jgi:CheY-like chemotaxis protein
MIVPKTTLVIDDDPDFVMAIRTLLASSGYQVFHALNGRDGLDQARQIAPDLILLDIMMSEPREGLHVLEELRRQPELCRTPVIVLSSIYSDELEFRVSPDAGWLPADLFLAKPVDPTRLLEEMQRLLCRSVAPAVAAGENR